MALKNNTHYIPSYFKAYELVPPEVYRDRGEKALQLMDSRILMTLDLLRLRYGAMLINNYKWGGNRRSSGLRLSTDRYFSKYSQHSFGRAVDIIFLNTTAEKVRRDIMNDPNNHTFRLITSFEEDTSWLHIDVRNVKRILRFPIPLKTNTKKYYHK